MNITIHQYTQFNVKPLEKELFKWENCKINHLSPEKSRGGFVQPGQRVGGILKREDNGP